MGVINLGILIKKIQSKLVKSGFVKSTDYATATKGGVVKIGNGLTIDENGVLVASGGDVYKTILDEILEDDIVEVELDNEYLRAYAFYGVSSLESISLPNLTDIPNYCFSRPSNIASSLESVSAPEAGAIGLQAFQGCSSLTTTNFPKVEGIGGSGFQNCTSLQSLTIKGSSTSQIGASCFSGCSNFDTLIITGDEVCGLNHSNAFSNTKFAANKTGGTIYVPASLVDSYKADAKWSTVLALNTNNNIVAIQ